MNLDVPAVHALAGEDAVAQPLGSFRIKSSKCWKRSPGGLGTFQKNHPLPRLSWWAPPPSLEGQVKNAPRPHTLTKDPAAERPLTRNCSPAQKGRPCGLELDVVISLGPGVCLRVFDHSDRGCPGVMGRVPLDQGDSS